MNRRRLRRMSLSLILGLVILGCATPALVTPPPSTPVLESVETIIVQTAAIAQTQTASALPPTATATITGLPSKTPTITPTPTATVVFLFPTNTSLPEGLFANENDGEEGSDGYEKPVVIREWDCRVLSQSPAKGAVITGGTTFKATWTVENTGTKTWPKKGVDIVFHSGAHLEAGRTYYDIPATVGPGGKVTISIPMAVPKRSKVYSTRWSLNVGRTDFCNVRFIIKVQ